MEQKYAEFVGVDNVHYAIVSQDDAAGYVTAAPQYLAPAAEIGGEPEVNNTTSYYDDKPGINYVSEGVTTLTITISGIPAQLAATLLGKDYDAASGRVYDDGKPNPPDVALGFRFQKGINDHRYYWYLKGNFSGGSEEAASKSSDVDARTFELTFTAVTTTKEWDIGGKSKSLKRIFADTTEPAFDPNGWFLQVQTPDTTVAPAAVALSSIVPADGANNVSRSANIVLTFNNKIKSEAITLLNASNGDVVSVTKTWDAAGKVLTITPAAQLAATNTFVVAVAGIVDVYGQALDAVGREFTTVA